MYPSFSSFYWRAVVCTDEVPPAAVYRRKIVMSVASRDLNPAALILTMKLSGFVVAGY